jgi:ankyrin repeat protein
MDPEYIFNAIETNNIQQIRKLIKEGFNFNINLNFKINYNGISPLNLTCRKSKYEIVKILVNEGNADVNMLDVGQCAPPLFECEDTDIVNFLIEKGTDLKIRNYQGFTLLEQLCWWSDGHIAEFLIKNINVFKIDITDGYWTPLICACEGEKFKLIKLLIEAGADINTRIDINFLCTPFMKSVCMSRMENDLENSTKILEYLITQGCNTGGVSDEGETFLDFITNEDLKIRLENLVKSLNVVMLKPAKK